MAEPIIQLPCACKATVIPAGDEVTLPESTPIELVQSLGGSLTVNSRGILYRLDNDALANIDPALLEAWGVSPAASVTITEGDFSEQQLWDALKTCYDPEIPINIVDLGLVYDLHFEATSPTTYEVSVKMTLTARGCGMGPVIAEDARRKLAALPSVASASVEIVWDPPWTPHMISQEGRQRLGIS
jgi:probable FeS assembly SUF system protein SufT